MALYQKRSLQMEFVFLLHQQFIYLFFNTYRRLNHFRRKLVSSIKAVRYFHRVLTSVKCREDLSLREGQAWPLEKNTTSVC